MTLYFLNNLSTIKSDAFLKEKQNKNKTNKTKTSMSFFDFDYYFTKLL